MANDDYHILCRAMNHQTADNLEQLLKEGYFAGPKVFEAAIQYPQCAQLLFNRGCEMDAHACRAAVFHHREDTKILEWLLACKCPCDKEASTWAAICGNILALDYLEKSGQEIDDEIIELSADGEGHKEVAMWGLNRGYKWGNTSIRATDIDYLKWAVSQGCPLLEGACVAAYIHGRDLLLKWLQESGCPFSEEAKKEAEEQRCQLEYNLRIEDINQMRMFSNKNRLKIED
jgi:hypothetical protein